MRYFKEFINIQYKHIRNLEIYDDKMEIMEKEISMWRKIYLNSKDLTDNPYVQSDIQCRFLFSENKEILEDKERLFNTIKKESIDSWTR